MLGRLPPASAGQIAAGRLLATNRPAAGRWLAVPAPPQRQPVHHRPGYAGHPPGAAPTATARTNGRIGWQRPLRGRFRPLARSAAATAPAHLSLHPVTYDHNRPPHHTQTRQSSGPGRKKWPHSAAGRRRRAAAAAAGLCVVGRPKRQERLTRAIQSPRRPPQQLCQSTQLSNRAARPSAAPVLCVDPSWRWSSPSWAPAHQISPSSTSTHLTAPPAAHRH